MAVVAVDVEVEDGFDVTVVPAGLRPVIVAVLFTAPASTSACVIVYAAVVVQVVDAPGASVVAGQLVAPTLASTTATPVMVVAPVLSTRKLYVIRSPASTRPLLFTSTGLLARLVSTRADWVAVVTVALELAEVTVAPAGFFVVAVAVLLTRPASTSAWVSV